MMRFALALVLPTTPVHSAFETTQSVLEGGFSYDPIHPAPFFWRAHPARLVDTPDRTFAVTARPFGLRELQLHAAGLHVHSGRIAWAIGLTSLGTAKLYRETDLSCALATTLGPRLRAGVGVHWATIGFGGAFDALSFVLYDVGLTARITGSLSIDVSATGHGQGRRNGRPFVQPRTRVGATWSCFEYLSLRAGHEIGTSGGWSAGETLRINQTLTLSADLLSNPLQIRIGTLISLGKLGFDFAYRDHPELGGDISAGLFWSL